jgi:hypothetical protein
MKLARVPLRRTGSPRLAMWERTHTMTLNPEQEQALQDLVACLPAKPSPPPSQERGQTGSIAGWAETWLGLSGEDVRAMLDGLVTGKDGIEAQLRGWSEAQPMDSAFGFIAAASLAFYSAEHGVNPKIKTVIDAFYYISTCASVGYADIFAMTQTGRTIAAMVMIVGPALASRALNRPGAPQA